MIKYLPLLFLMACNSESKKEIPVQVGANITDSLSTAIDSLKESLSDLSGLSDFAQSAQNKISRLEKERANLLRDLGEKSPSYMTIRYDTSKSYKPQTANDYSKRIYDLEMEVARLRKRIASDSSYIARMNKTGSPIEDIEKPDDNSLIVQPVPSNNIDVYLIPYSKKAKKKLMVYEASCDLSLINDFGGKLAGNYKGQFFFNDVEPGKYIVKLCTYFGNYQVIEKTQDKQVIVMVTSPPIK